MEPREITLDGEPLPEGIQVVYHGYDSYILINGRLLTAYDAPVSGNEDAAYHAFEDIVRQLMEERRMSLEGVERHFDNDNQLWPRRGDVFDAETTIALYRMLKRARE